jgi:hypothetical protein
MNGNTYFTGEKVDAKKRYHGLGFKLVKLVTRLQRS